MTLGYQGQFFETTGYISKAQTKLNNAICNFTYILYMYVAEENIIMASLIFVHNRFVEYISTKTTTYII